MSLFAEPLVLLIVVIITATLLYYYRSSILFRQSLKRTEIPRKKWLGAPDTQTRTECPKCGRTMDDGYLLGPGGLYWSQVAPLYQDGVGIPFGRRGIFGAPMGAEPLGTPMFGSLGRLPHLKAYRCLSCNLMYVDLQKQEMGD